MFLLNELKQPSHPDTHEHEADLFGAVLLEGSGPEFFLSNTIIYFFALVI